VLDQRLVEQVAGALGSPPGLVEKDWHVVRALGVIRQVEPQGMAPAFSGGTSLSKGWELLKRFSEDIDFKVAEPRHASLSAGRRARGVYRQRLLKALTAGGFTIEGTPEVGNQKRDGGYRRVSPAAARSRDGLLSEPRAGAQSWRRGPLNLPRGRHCPTR
jgi:predicted nucleotidyltransferase component of viral defense system